MSIEDGFLPEPILDDVVLIVNAFVHPAASIAKRVEFNNYKAVRQAVRKLPLPQCQVITLVDLEGFTYASVAEILEIPVGTVMSRLCRGRRALKEFLTDVWSQQDANRTMNLMRIK